MTVKSAVMVGVQLVCIALLVATGPVIPYGTAPLVMAAVGITIILWAAAALGFDNVRVPPELPAEARLSTRGPYRAVRHPMYSGGVMIAGAWVWDHFTAFRLMVLVVLVVDFAVKLSYEEQLLRERFPEYEEYMRKTWRLVPGLY